MASQNEITAVAILMANSDQVMVLTRLAWRIMIDQSN
jgi:hypothetical protein